jgi:SAM-dependent methyltransferase
LHALKERGVVLKNGEPSTLVDLGCGEGHTAYEMIEAINRVHPQGDGINYYGLDADERFVRSTERLLLKG